MKHLPNYLPGIILSFAFFLVGILTISDYGISWDAQFRMMKGQANLLLYSTGQTSFNLPPHVPPVLIKPDEKATKYHYNAFEFDDATLTKLPDRPIPQQNINPNHGSFYQDDIWTNYFLFREDVGHLALTDDLAALSNKIFYQWLGIFGDIESYQLIYLLSCAIGIFVVSSFTYQITKSVFASFIAGLSLGMYPLFFGDAHINLKDPIQASFYAGCIWALWNWISENKRKWLYALVAFTCCALGVKWNLILLPFVLVPWILLACRSKEFKVWFKWKKRLLELGISGIAILVFIYVISPLAWHDPIGRFLGTLKFYADNGLGSNSLQPDGFLGPFGINFYPIFLFFTQTPELVLLLIFVGVVFAISGYKKTSLNTPLLILLWAFEPLLRLSMPHARSLLGLRQAMEMLPALAILAGLGAYYLDQRLHFNQWKQIGVGVVFFIVLAIPLIQLHPNQNAYFNILTGGVSGAVENHGVDWTLTYGNIYKQGAVWLNQHAEKDANIALIDGAAFGLSPLWLRKDISISPYHFSGLEQKGEYIPVLYDGDDIPLFAYLYTKRFLRPVYSVKVGGVALLSIYKNSPEYRIEGFKTEKPVEKISLKQVKNKGQFYLGVTMGQPYKVTRIIIRGADKDCISHRINDLFDFQTMDEALYHAIDSYKLFAFNETKILPDDKIEIDFPGELSSEIVILPANLTSCFEYGHLDQIYAIQ